MGIKQFIILFILIIISTFVYAIPQQSEIYLTSEVQKCSDTVIDVSVAPDSLCVNATIDSLLSFAKMHIGIPYRYGGKNEKGFDCSGFTSYIFKHFGFILPPTSDGQAFYGDTISKENIKIGDLVFFKGRNSKSTRIGHVGIVTEITENDILFIHSSSNKGIMITSINSDYYYKRYVTARRLLR